MQNMVVSQPVSTGWKSSRNRNDLIGETFFIRRKSRPEPNGQSGERCAGTPAGKSPADAVATVIPAGSVMPNTPPRPETGSVRVAGRGLAL